MSPLLIEANSLSFAYRNNQVLEQLSLTVPHSQVIGLMGINGSGKSTLLKLLSGIIPPQAGTIKLDGTPLTQLSRKELTAKLSFVPQELPLNSEFTVKELIAMGRNPHLGRFSSMADSDHSAIRQAIEQSGLSGLENRQLDSLSGGERKSVFIARALAQEAKLLLLDEPLASLDIAHQINLLNLLKKISSQGATTILSLHDFSLAAQYCDRLIILHQRTIAATGTPIDILSPQLLNNIFQVEIKPADTIESEISFMQQFCVFRTGTLHEG